MKPRRFDYACPQSVEETLALLRNAPPRTKLLAGGQSLVPLLNERAIELEHLGTASPNTLIGVKGMGEGGMLGAPAAVTNAVADALRPFGVRPDQLPLTPERILSLTSPK